jgi:GH25 family lysozyme M1 (1,4-beta-N-acetylmuramidase)
MWYTVSREKIAEMAQAWIDRVETATGKPVIIYTNPAWWNPVMAQAGEQLMSKHAVWTSRYTSKGPQYDKKWTEQGGSEKWGMAPLPRGASYPKDSYDVAYSWQFTETGFLSQNVFSCSGVYTAKAMDVD